LALRPGYSPEGDGNADDNNHGFNRPEVPERIHMTKAV
jgi:hypothetical protein